MKITYFMICWGLTCWKRRSERPESESCLGIARNGPKRANKSKILVPTGQKWTKIWGQFLKNYTVIINHTVGLCICTIWQTYRKVFAALTATWWTVCRVVYITVYAMVLAMDYTMVYANGIYNGKYHGIHHCIYHGICNNILYRHYEKTH